MPLDGSERAWQECWGQRVNEGGVQVESERYCLALGQVTLQVRTESGQQALPAALYGNAVGREALERGGLRVRRVVRWDEAGRQTWWRLLEQVVAVSSTGEGDIATVVAVPGGAQVEAIPTPFNPVYSIPPTVALRAAAGETPAGVALYLGALAWEVASFGPQEMGEPKVIPGGLEPLYLAVVGDLFRQERRPLLPVQVPPLLEEGWPLPEGNWLPATLPASPGPLLLAAEDEVVGQAIGRTLIGQGYEVVFPNPLDGLERLAVAAGLLPVPGGSR